MLSSYRVQVRTTWGSPHPGALSPRNLSAGLLSAITGGRTRSDICFPKVSIPTDP
jgi:hypothetical protein